MLSRLAWVRILIGASIGGLVAVAVGTDGDQGLISLIPAFAAYVLSWTVKEADDA